MLSGTQPWRGRSHDEIFNSVVLRKERPSLPDGLPPEIENVLVGCFDYDLRNRPSMTHIIQAFQRYEITLFGSQYFSFCCCQDNVLAKVCTGQWYFFFHTCNGVCQLLSTCFSAHQLLVLFFAFYWFAFKLLVHLVCVSIDCCVKCEVEVNKDCIEAP